ncbi:DNA repair protein RecO [bacterium]|nr:DNA repair protein RecO [bacterium]
MRTLQIRDSPSPKSSLHLDGLILRSYPSGESDCIYRILTREQGKVSAIAKGVKKSKRRFASLPEPFDIGQAELRRGRGELWLFNGFTPQKTLLSLRTSLDLFSIACTLSESFDGVLPEESEEHAEALYHAAVDGLQAVSECNSAEEAYRPAIGALRKLLRIAGFLRERTETHRGEECSTTEPSGAQRLSEEWDWITSQVEEVLNRKLRSKPG